MPPVDQARWQPYVATAYGPPWGGIQGSGTTASGIHLNGDPRQFLLIATDPHTLPLGTKIQFDQNPFGDPSLIFTASDTGGAIVGNNIDFYVASGRQAQNGWGRKQINGRVVGSGSPKDVAILGNNGGSSPGGTANAGGTGTLLNDTSGFRVGDATNPDEDFWTAMNRLAQERYWYLFSDGETLYLADGPDLMQQTPAFELDRVGDGAAISHIDFTFDNTAWLYAATHKRRKRTQRRTALAKVVSPVGGSLNLICAIDAVRAGDVVKMSNCGPGDGQWLVGDCRRSVFEITSEVNLVQALSPLSEGALNPAQVNSNNLSSIFGAGGFAGSGTAKAVLQAAIAAIGGPYTQQHHDAVNFTANQVKSLGTDCSGFVSYLMGPNGLKIWTQSFATPAIPTAPGLIGGPGTQITIFNNPNPGNAGHVWIEILHRFFECAGQIGVHEMSAGQAASYLATGQYFRFHPVGY